MSDAVSKPANFIRHIVTADVEAGKNGGKVATRFPPEPNGYLHIGHAKSICLNFGIAEEFKGTCNLRFDDTNPVKEDVEYVESIQEDVSWLGFKWNGEPRYASNYFQMFFDYAVDLIKQGKAYVCELNAEQTREYRGTLKEPGKNSPFRDRSVEENLALFEKMRAGEFDEGAAVLRAKIDMASPNMNLRDPTIYRVRKAHHHQTGDQWCIYPMYDYAHCISDAVEGITHSLCTLEFEDHRPLYDWFLDQLDVPCHPQQIEFSRLSLEYTVMSKRKLNELVMTKSVSGWDDPRMPTISGLRRRGYTPASLRMFCERIGVTKADNMVEIGMLEATIREDLDKNAPRAMCVLNPLKVTIKNYEASKTETLTLKNHPQQDEMGTREIEFGHEVWIDRSDFEEIPPKKYKRLSPGEEVRLRGAYVIRCDEMVKNEAGEIVELICSYDPETLGKNPEGRKVKGVIHWAPVHNALDVEIRLYDRLFKHPNPDGDKDVDDFKVHLNPDSLQILEHAKAEPSLHNALAGQGYQFEREGYFCLDGKAEGSQKLVFNRTVTLRDSWAKEQGK